MVEVLASVLSRLGAPCAVLPRPDGRSRGHQNQPSRFGIIAHLESTTQGPSVHHPSVSQLCAHLPGPSRDAVGYDTNRERTCAPKRGGTPWIFLRRKGTAEHVVFLVARPRSVTYSGPVHLYSRRPARLVRQLLADLFALVWVVAWVQVGSAVHNSVADFARPVRDMQGIGEGYEQTFDDLAKRVAELPVLGAQLSGALDAVSTPGDALSTTAATLAADIERYADTLGLAVTWIPLLMYVIPWLLLRARFVARSYEISTIASRPGSHSLLAARALTHLPLAELMSLHPDPAEAWRLGDPELVRKLADLELKDSGARLPRELNRARVTRRDV